MSNTRSLAKLLVLAIMSGACNTIDTLAPPNHDASDPIESVLASVNSEDPRDGERGGPSLFDRLAAEIPGFGGLYRVDRCSIAVVLTDLTQAQHAIRVVKAALEPLRGCPDGIRVQAVQGKFTYIELQRYLKASRPLFRIEGVVGVAINYEKNRLVVTVISREVAEKVLEALPRLNIPAEAVVFELGRPREPRGSTGRSRG
jgi:hypothetical protein